MAETHGLEQTLDMNLNQLFAIYKLKARRDNLQMIALATATRVASASQDDFKKYVNNLGG